MGAVTNSKFEIISMTGYISEVFTSIQGEGIKVGQRQTFIRFLGCNLSCNYCDTPISQKMKGALIIGNRVYQNPVTADLLFDFIDASEAAITGGEPLLQSEFLLQLCERLKTEKKSVYLETNGTLSNELKKVIKHVDWIALDFKIPTATGRPGLWHEHEKSLSTAAQKKVFVKIIINENIVPRELDKVCSIIEKVSRDIPLVIQPAHGKSIPNILEIQKKALTRLNDVRVIPQIHKFMKVR